MRASDSKSYLPQVKTILLISINKKAINADYSAFTEKYEANPKACKFKVNDRVRIRKYKNIFSKGYTKKWSSKIFNIDLVLNTNPWTHKIKD